MTDLKQVFRLPILRGAALIGGFLVVSGQSAAIADIDADRSVAAPTAITVDGQQYYDFMVASVAGRDAQHLDAVTHYLRALEQDPDSDLMISLAFIELLQAGKYDQARQLSRTYVDEGQGLENDLLLQVYLLDALANKETDTVRAQLDEARSKNFGHILSPLYEGWSYAIDGDKEAALAGFAKITGNPLFDEVSKVNQALALDYMGFSSEANDHFKAIVDGDVINLRTLVVYADFLFRNGQAAEASQMLRSNLQRYDNNVYLYRSTIRLERGIGLSIKPATPLGSISLFLNQLATELAQGRSSGIAALYARLSIIATPGYDDGYVLLSDILAGDDRNIEAATTLLSVHDTSPLYQIARYKRVSALRAAGLNNEARSDIQAMLVENPDRVNLMTTLADIYRSEEAWNDALFWYDQALEKRPKMRNSDWYIVFSRAVCLFELGDWPAAEIGMLQALNLAPNEPTVLNYLGYSWIDRGVKMEAATNMIRQAVELQPDDGFILDSYGWAYYVAGNYQDAVIQLEKAVRLEPEDVTINEHLGDAYWKVGRKIEARFQWQYAIQAGPTASERPSLAGKLAYGLDVWEGQLRDEQTGR